MIAKCIVILAIVAQINASECGKRSVFLSSNRVVASVPSDNFSRYSSGPITKNLVGKGKFPVVLRNCGPNPDDKIPVTTSHITVPTQEKPTIRLPAKIPAPRVISHTCTCYKTIVRPRVHHQFITVPSVQRYIQTTHKPVVERYQYEAQANNCESPIQVVPAVQPVTDFTALRALETVQPVPTVEIVRAPKVQGVEIPSFQVSQRLSFGSTCSC